MRKFTYLLLAAACSVPVANAQETHYLRSINSITVPQEYEEYFYGNDNLVDSVHWANEEYEHSCSFVYDDNGNPTRRDSYQVIGFSNSHTGYVNYMYDDEGFINLRQNYMDYGWGMTQQGTYTYTYNDEKQLVRIDVYLGSEWGEGASIYQYSEYEYDQDGNLSVTRTYTPNDNQQLYLSQQLNYTYDAQGRTASVLTKIDNGNGVLADSQRIDYTYDADGNLDNVTTYLANSGWRPASATYYFYDTTVSSEDAVYPRDTESQWGTSIPEYSANIVVRDSLCNEEGGSWATFDVKHYNYSTDPGTGIKEQVADSNSDNTLAIVVLGDRIYASGIKVGESIQIYDCSGRLVLTGRYTENGIPAYGLPEGVKVLKAGNAAGKFL